MLDKNTTLNPFDSTISILKENPEGKKLLDNYFKALGVNEFHIVSEDYKEGLEIIVENSCRNLVVDKLIENNDSICISHHESFHGLFTQLRRAVRKFIRTHENEYNEQLLHEYRKNNTMLGTINMDEY